MCRKSKTKLSCNDYRFIITLYCCHFTLRLAANHLHKYHRIKSPAISSKIENAHTAFSLYFVHIHGVVHNCRGQLSSIHTCMLRALNRIQFVLIRCRVSYCILVRHSTGKCMMKVYSATKANGTELNGTERQGAGYDCCQPRNHRVLAVLLMM